METEVFYSLLYAMMQKIQYTANYECVIIDLSLAIEYDRHIKNREMSIMAVLSDVRLLEKIYDKQLEIDPFIYSHIQPSSIDLTLDENIMVPRACSDEPIHVYEQDLSKYYEPKSIVSHVLEPNDFIIASIRETIKLSGSMTGRIENRNSLVRLGINVNLSGYINPGYSGKLPIVIKNIGKLKVKLVSGMRICQLVISDVVPETKTDYAHRKDAKYQNESGADIPKLYLDEEFREYIKRYGLQDKINNKQLSEFLKNRLDNQAKSYLDELSDQDKIKLGLK